MDISKITFGNKVQLFLQNRWTWPWYALLAATFIPFFATDIEWKPIAELQLEDDAAAFFIMLSISLVFLLLLLMSVKRKLAFYANADITWGKGYADSDSMTFVRSLSKAWHVPFKCVMSGVEYQLVSGPITGVDFDKEYEFCVMYNPQDPTQYKIITDLPKGVQKSLCATNGIVYQDDESD